MSAQTRVKARDVRRDSEVFYDGYWHRVTDVVRDGRTVWIRCGFELMSIRTRAREKFLTRPRAAVGVPVEPEEAR